MDLETVLATVQEEYRYFYRTHWLTITGSKIGLIKDVRYYPLITDTNEEIENNIRKTLHHYNKPAKVNVSFGFLLREGVELDGPLKFYHPSLNNSKVFDTPRIIRGDDDVEALMKDVEYSDALDYAKNQRPSTKWRTEKIICLRIDIYKIRQT